LSFNGLSFDLFTEIRNLLVGSQDVSCVWHGCDPWTTPAVRGVDGDGTRSNCGRTNKDGINWFKSEVPSQIRLAALYNTPQDCGGCKDCRFFTMCKGYCPGTGIDGDWRNRTEHCEVLKALFTHFESKVKNPVSLSPRLKHFEDLVLNHGSHSDAAHGDAPHGDLHLDSNALRKVEGIVPCVD
jgi:uncharacterized protein